MDLNQIHLLTKKGISHLSCGFLCPTSLHLRDEALDGSVPADERMWRADVVKAALQDMAERDWKQTRLELATPIHRGAIRGEACLLLKLE